MPNHSAIINTPIGKISIQCKSNVLTTINFLLSSATLKKPQDSFSKEVCQQLLAYFNDANHSFDIPLSRGNTPFQTRFRRRLTAIPLGQTKTYGQLAKTLKSSAQAIGQACRHNPFPIIVPCHRIVSQSSFGGFAGQTAGEKLKIKQWLLQHESNL